jgi:Flp pilus assembly protein TadG
MFLPRGRRGASRRFGHKLLGDAGGGAAVEFAIAGPVTILLACMAVDMGLALFTQAALDNGARDAARLIMTGQVQMAGGSPAPFTARLCADVSYLVPCGSVQYNVAAAKSFAALTTATIGSNGTLLDPQFVPGTPGQDVMVQVAYYRTPIVPWLGEFLGGQSGLLLMSTITFQNEPFP